MAASLGQNGEPCEPSLTILYLLITVVMAAAADPAPEAKAGATTTTNGSSPTAAPEPAPSQETIKAYDSPESLKALADVLRSKVKIRHGVLREMRVEYFKGGPDATRGLMGSAAKRRIS